MHHSGMPKIQLRLGIKNIDERSTYLTDHIPRIPAYPKRKGVDDDDDHNDE